MKKTFYIFSVAAVLLAAGCNKSEQPAAAPSEPQVPAEESGIVLYAQDINAIGSPAVKTATAENEEGKFTVNWIDGDQIAVYTVPAGTDPTTFDLGTWQSGQPVRFITEKSTENGLRVFALNETDSDAGKVAAFKERYAAGNLDWYAVYPGFMDTPSLAGYGMVVLGKNGKANVVQDGNNSTAHLARQDVLFGKVLGSKEPVIEMKHLGTLMKFDVSNGTGESFTVQSITVSTSDIIAGEFRLGLSNDEPIDKTNGFEQSGINILEVKQAEAIEPGNKASFYQILAPFTVASGQTVSITVKTDKGNWSKIMTAGNGALTFEAGKKYTAKLNVTTGIKEVRNVNLGIGNNASATDGAYLSLRTGETFKQPAEAEYKDIDLIAVYASGAPKLVAPGDIYTFDWILTDVKDWSVRNTTLLKETSLTEADYNAVKDSFELKKIYDAATGTANTSLSGLTKANAQGKVYAAMTSGGRYALIHYADVIGWSVELQMNDHVQLNLKIEE